eukprot:Colp12_sorted_trinity150504_noHs@22242
MQPENTGKKSSYVIIPGTEIQPGFEISVCRPPKSMLRDLKLVFPEIELQDCLIVPTFQKAVSDLVSIGPEVEDEKDALLENFVDWAGQVCDQLSDSGFWADMTDPASGFPMRSNGGPSFYPEVVGAEVLLRYSVQTTGCCKVLSHPRWGSNVYPATLFTTAPLPALLKALGLPEGQATAPS